MFLVMAMVRVEQISELADLVLSVNRFDLGVVDMCMSQFFMKSTDGMLEVVFEMIPLGLLDVPVVVSHSADLDHRESTKISDRTLM